MTNLLLAQEAETIRFYGKAVQSSKAVVNAHILNHSIGTGTVSDLEGNFGLNVNKGDTISFSALGFKKVIFIIPDTVNPSYRVLVNMVADTILLQETVIMPWPANRTMLKQAMLDHETEEERVGVYAGFVKNDAPVEQPKAKIYNPISFLYNAFNKKARQQKKIEKWRQEMDAYENEKESNKEDVKY